MGRQFSLPYQIPPTAMLAPAADAAGRTSGYFSLKNAVKAWIVAHVNQGNAATVQLTPLQAKDVSGTSSKAITATPIWSNADTAAIAAPGAKQTDAANFTTSAAVKDKIVVFEIVPEQCMDVNNGFVSIALQTGASNAANITAAELFILGSFEQTSPPSPLTN
ncbi:hypothetical protein [Bradyrhizobium sp. SRS-191]|uniref:hypothetical protein n=1 Tax=Bradyrhizobium sp. SRS-191 TaxID=2962606 RepID=UPI00211ED50B|nr:hypothetical protein [Bradyrhizobium sp. SRS-191]